MPTTKRAVGYARLSKEAPDSLSIESQRAGIRKLCRDRGWQLVEVYVDDDESAFNGRQRPGLEALRQRLGEIDAIVFRDLDRLTRTPREGIELAEACQAAGVEMVAYRKGEAIDTTSAEGEFTYGLALGLARLESKRTQQRVMDGLATARSKGHHVGGVPYGWRRVAKKLEPHPAEQKALRKAARSYVAGGTYAEAAAILGVGYPTVAQRIFRNPRVQEALGELGHQLLAVMAGRRMERGPSTRSLLGGIAVCDVCGGGLRRSSTRAGRSGRWHQYRCSESGHAGIGGPFLEQHVTEAVLGAIDLRALTRRVKERAERPAAADVLAIDARMRQYEEMAIAGRIEPDEWERLRTGLKARRVEAEEQVATEHATSLPIELARRLPDEWDDLSIDTQRRIIKALLSEVRVAKANGHGPIDPTRIELVWR